MIIASHSNASMNEAKDFSKHNLVVLADNLSDQLNRINMVPAESHFYDKSGGHATDDNGEVVKEPKSFSLDFITTSKEIKLNLRHDGSKLTATISGIRRGGIKLTSKAAISEFGSVVTAVTKMNPDVIWI